MGLPNLPEGFNAYRELVNLNHNSSKTLHIMCLLVAIGPVAGLGGLLFLSEEPFILGAIMLFSSGGILYLIFQDIAPQARLKNLWAPSLGAVSVFCLALFSQMMMT